MDGHRVALTPDGHVDHAASVDLDDRPFVHRPRDDVPQQAAVVGRHHFPERAIDVPRNIGDASPAEVAQVELACVGVRHARVDVFHRQVGIGRDQRQRRRKVARRPDVHAKDAVDDARRVFEALQHGVMRLRLCGSASRLRYEFCIGPSMRPLKP